MGSWWNPVGSIDEALERARDVDEQNTGGTPIGLSGITGTGGALAKAATFVPRGSQLLNVGSKLPKAAKFLPGAAAFSLEATTEAKDAFESETLTFTPDYDYDPNAPKDAPLGLIVAIVAVGAIILLGRGGEHGA